MRLFVSKLLAVLLVLSLAGTALAQDVKVAIGLSLPPYVISDSNSGMEFEIVKEALAMKGYNLVPHYVPFARVVKDFSNKEADAAMTVTPALGLMGAVYSDKVITYQNVGITLKKNNLKVDSLADLAGKEVLAFQNAKSILGQDFAKAVEGAKYREIADQDKQVVMFFRGRADVLVGDINIFKFYRAKSEADTSAEVVVHEIFAPTDYSVAFRDKKICDDFNAALAELKASGKYDAIIKKYVK